MHETPNFRPLTRWWRRLGGLLVSDTVHVAADEATPVVSHEGVRIDGIHANGEKFTLLAPSGDPYEIAKRLAISGWDTFHQVQSAAGVAPDLLAIRAAIGESADK